MAISLDVLTALNERSAQDAADQAAKIFGDAGEDAGKAFGEALDKGLDTRPYERKMDRAADAAGKVRVAEQKLAEMRAKGASDTQVVAQAERLSAARRAEGAAVRDAAAEYRKLAEAQRSTHSALSNLGSSFGTGLTRGVPFLSGAIAELRSFEGISGKAGFVAGKALGMAFTTAATGAMGLIATVLFKGFERYRNIDAARNSLESLNKSMERTGKAGFNVKAVMDTVNDVVLGTPIALDKAMSVAARAMGSPTGDLKRFMTVVTDAAVQSDTDFDTIASAMLKVANSGKLSADILNNEFAKVNVRPALQEQFHVTGAALDKMISKGKVGLEDLMRAVETTASGAAKEAGNTVNGAMEQINTAMGRLGSNFISAVFGDPMKEGGNEIVDFLTTIKNKFDDVNKWVVAHKDDIREFFVQAKDVAQDVITVLGEVFEKLDSVANAMGGWKNLIETAGTAFLAWKTIGVIKSIAEVASSIGLIGKNLAAIPEKAGAARAALILLAAEAAKEAGEEFYGRLQAKIMSDPPEKMPDGTWSLTEKRPGSVKDGGGSVLHTFTDEAAAKAAQARRDQGVPNWWEPPKPPTFGPRDPAAGGALGGQAFFDWIAEEMKKGQSGQEGPHGSPILTPGGDDDEGKKGKGPRLPDAPVLDYDSTPLAGFTPSTAAEYAAQNSFLDARHKLAEKRARLSQLEGEANATDADKIKARNDVLAAERNLDQAERRLTEARQRQLEKANKTLKGLTSDLGDIGASLDKDFGISKGLAGIAENITKFVANLAAAPLLGQLSATSANSRSQGGYGLMGILGAQGVFGPAFLGIDDTTQTQGGGYGLPGGSGSYGKIGLDQIDQIAARFGLTVSSADRPGDPGYHGKGQAHDYAGPQAAMTAFAQYMNQNYGGQLKELIHDAPGFSGNVKDGRNVGAFGQFYTNAQAGPHNDHVHVAADPMSSALDANTAALNANTGAVNGDHVANWDMIAQRESSGNWSNMDTGNNGHYGGLQFSPSTWNAYGGQEFASNPAYASAEQQKTVADRVVTGYNGVAPQGLNAWEVYTQASPADRAAMATPTGYGTAGTAGYSSPTGYGVPGGSLGMPGQGGLGAPTGFMQPTQIGAAVDPPRGAGGGGGVGISGDGAIGMAMQAGGMALDMMAPGAGQAAQMGMKLLNRTIEYGGQAAGIAAGGLMETFLPTGGSDLANNNWLTRIMGGLAGAAPALPNLAGGKGKAQPPLDGQQGQAGQQGQGGVQIGDINVTNQRPTEDGTGRDIAYHLNNQYSGPGM